MTDRRFLGFQCTRANVSTPLLMDREALMRVSSHRCRIPSWKRRRELPSSDLLQRLLPVMRKLFHVGVSNRRVHCRQCVILANVIYAVMLFVERRQFHLGQPYPSHLARILLDVDVGPHARRGRAFGRKTVADFRTVSSFRKPFFQHLLCCQ